MARYLESGTRVLGGAAAGQKPDVDSRFAARGSGFQANSARERAVRHRHFMAKKVWLMLADGNGGCVGGRVFCAPDRHIFEYPLIPIDNRHWES
jgi:hypothetical protein